MQKQPVLRVFQTLFGLFVGVMAVVGAFFLFIVVFMRALRMEGVRNRFRTFSKRYNSRALKTAGKRGENFAVIKHVGRRSGREYATPIATTRMGDDSFIIALPYGSNTDWCRNVMAAGTCGLVWDGQEYTLNRPEILTQAQALPAYTRVQRLIFMAGGVKEYLLLHQATELHQVAEAPESVPTGQ